MGILKNWMEYWEERHKKFIEDEEQYERKIINLETANKLVYERCIKLKKDNEELRERIRVLENADCRCHDINTDC
jgi:uridine kinase